MDNMVLKEYGRYRTVLVNDCDGWMPDGDGYVPQIVIRAGYDSSGSGLNWDDADVTKGELLYTLERLGSAELVARWARIFHGVNAKVFETRGYSQSDWAEVLVWPSESWRKKVGTPEGWEPTSGDVADLGAWLWGDVYGVQLERRVTWTSEDGDTEDRWEPVDSIGGFYGASWDLAKDDYVVNYFDGEAAA